MAAPAVQSGATPISGASTDSLPKFSEGPKIFELLPKSLTGDFKKEQMGRGVLIPLKTVAEVTQEHTVTHVYITRAPTKCANDILR
jgi:tRNA-specific adenosine deaminase 3